MKALDAPVTQDKTPLVARFATVRYDLGEFESLQSPAKIIASPFGEHTVTYSATTKGGSDNDKSDQQRD
jgi:hypothetical protein